MGHPNICTSSIQTLADVKIIFCGGADAPRCISRVRSHVQTWEMAYRPVMSHQCVWHCMASTRKIRFRKLLMGLNETTKSNWCQKKSMKACERRVLKVFWHWKKCTESLHLVFDFFLKFSHFCIMNGFVLISFCSLT